MTRVTLRTLNAWIKTEWPDLNVTMYRDRSGYFYFIGEHELPSIYVWALHNMNLDAWKHMIRDSVKDSQTYRFAR